MRLVDAGDLSDKVFEIARSRTMGMDDRKAQNFMRESGLIDVLTAIGRAKTIRSECWISVRDMLPSETGWYWAYSKGTGAHDFYFNGELFGGVLTGRDHDTFIPNHYVTHWMPLPGEPDDDSE